MGGLIKNNKVKHKNGNGKVSVVITMVKVALIYNKNVRGIRGTVY